MKKLIVYDLDGTLVDTRRDIVLGVNFVRQSLGCDDLPEAEIESYVGTGLHDLMRKSLKTTDQNLVEKGGNIFKKYYQDHMLDHSVLYTGAAETLDYFKDRKQAVLTNKPSPFSERIVEHLGVERFMMSVLTGGNGRPYKPDPALFNSLMEQAGVKADECLFLGDSSVDFETGRNAGVETVLFTHGFTSRGDLEVLKPDFIFESFDEFLKQAKQNHW